MGSFIEINDTLQLTREQGFPAELDLETHLRTPYHVEQFKNRIFAFKDKPAIRLYQIPPVRNFLVENRDSKWIYWGKVHILSISCDYVNLMTSGTFKIVSLNTPQEMKTAFKVIDERNEFDFFAE